MYHQSRKFFEAIFCIKSPKSAWSIVAQETKAFELQICQYCVNLSSFPKAERKACALPTRLFLFPLGPRTGNSLPASHSPKGKCSLLPFLKDKNQQVNLNAVLSSNVADTLSFFQASVFLSLVFKQKQPRNSAQYLLSVLTESVFGPLNSSVF